MVSLPKRLTATAMEGRALTTGEIEIARSVFGDTINYAKVRLFKQKWWPFHPRNAAMAPMGNIYFHPEGGVWSEDFANESLSRQGFFIHEMTHSGIEFHRHACSHVPEDRSRLAYANRGDVPVDVAASKKCRCIVETALIISRRSVGTDQSTAQTSNAAIPARISRSVFGT